MHALDSPQVSNLTFEELPNDFGLQRRMERGETRNIEAFLRQRRGNLFARGSSHKISERAHLGGHLKQPLAQPRRVVALEHRHELVTNPIAQNCVGLIGAIDHETLADTLKIREDLGSGYIKHRANSAPWPALSHRRKSARTRTAQDSNHHGFGLIAGVMRERDQIGFEALGCGVQERMPRISRTLFEIRRRWR